LKADEAWAQLTKASSFGARTPQMSFASMQSMANQRAINQKPRRRKPQPRPEWGAEPEPAPRAAMGGARGGAARQFGASWDGASALPKLGGGGAPKGGGPRREVVHGRRASGSGTPGGGGRRASSGAGGSGRGPRGSGRGGGSAGGPRLVEPTPAPAPMPPPPSLLEQAPILTEEQILSMTDEEVEEMLAKVRQAPSLARPDSCLSIPVAFGSLLTVGCWCPRAQSMMVQDLLMSELAAQEEKLTPRASMAAGGGAVGPAAAVGTGSRETQLDSLS
jgi:hypothetical protein